MRHKLYKAQMTNLPPMPAKNVGFSQLGMRPNPSKIPLLKDNNNRDLKSDLKMGRHQKSQLIQRKIKSNFEADGGEHYSR